MLKRLVRFDFIEYLTNYFGNDTYDSFARYVADTLEAIKKKYPAANEIQILGGVCQGLDKRFKGNNGKAEIRVKCTGTADAYNTIIDHWDEFDMFKDIMTVFVDLKN